MSKNCKKCGKEIPQTSKKNLCEKCQNEEIGKIRKIGEVVLGLLGTVVSVGLLVITKGKFGGPKT